MDPTPNRSKITELKHTMLKYLLEFCSLGEIFLLFISLRKIKMLSSSLPYTEMFENMKKCKLAPSVGFVGPSRCGKSTIIGIILSHLNGINPEQYKIYS